MSPLNTPSPVVSRGDLEAVAETLYPDAASQAQVVLAQLKSMTRLAQRMPAVAVVGRFSAGKSRFLNALVGAEVLPVDTDLVRLGLFEMAYGKCLQYQRLAQQATKARTWEHVPADEPLRVAAQYQQARELEPPTDKYGVLVPSPILRELRLLDTPGYDSPVARRFPQWALNQVLRACRRAEMCLIVLDNNADEATVQVAAKVSAACPLVALVVSKSDKWHPDSALLIAEDSAETLEPVLGYRPEAFCVSSLWETARPAERTEMMRRPPLSLYGSEPRNEWAKLVRFIRTEVKASRARQLLKTLRAARGALDGARKLETLYSQQRQAEHVLPSRLADLGTYVSDDPLNLMADITRAVMGGEPVPWLLLERLGIGPAHLAPEMRVSAGEGSLANEIAGIGHGQLTSVFAECGRDVPHPVLNGIENELGQMDHDLHASGTVRLMLQTAREWTQWRETTERGDARHDRALDELLQRWFRSPELERGDVNWILDGLTELHRPHASREGAALAETPVPSACP